ncbi:MAG: DUF4254 domain-containing protein [Gemmatimonadetes bacterium]|nr:DUF4254 domain-containing protein [Gemmatimonadota bacterium]
MAETVGSLVDKISIVELKIFHMQEQTDREDASPEFRVQCQDRLSILRRQRDDLAEELSDLVAAVASGKVVPKVYRQFKMYNDPSYRRGASDPRAS